jgi:acylphosphatase
MTNPDDHRRFTVHFSGTVQGVGFRYTTERVARRFAVTGYVRNLPDGRVEAVVEGAPAEIDLFLKTLDETMAGYIRGREVAEGPATGEFAGFRIAI